MVQDDNSSNAPKKPMIYYYAIVLLVMMLLNSLLFPALMQRRVTEVSYDTFLSMVDEGSVTEVAYEQDEQLIVFAAKNSSGKEDLYKTGVFPDDGLRQRLEAAGVTFTAEIPTQNSPLLNFLLTWIFPLIIFAVVGQLLMRSLSKRMGGEQRHELRQVQRQDLRRGRRRASPSPTSPAQDEAKEALREIVDFLHNPQKYADIGAKLPKGALLVGPPGTGKTLLAARRGRRGARARSSPSPARNSCEMFVGMGAAKVRDLFKQANEKAPCIVFIDEIDTIGKKRDNGAMRRQRRARTDAEPASDRNGRLRRRINGVVILAATNRPESLDPALLRPGRFDRRIPVELPDLAGREAILRVHAKDVKMEPSRRLHRHRSRDQPALRARSLPTSSTKRRCAPCAMGRSLVNAVRSGGERRDRHRGLSAQERRA